MGQLKVTKRYETHFLPYQYMRTQKAVQEKSALKQKPEQIWKVEEISGSSERAKGKEKKNNYKKMNKMFPSASVLSDHESIWNKLHPWPAFLFLKGKRRTFV